MNREQSFPGENPFCTRRIRPGALPYLFPPEMPVERFLERLQNTSGWGEIIGPHGSGKSTLLAALIPALQAAGWQTQLFELHDGQRRLPVNLRQIEPNSPLPLGEGQGVRASDAKTPLILIVDGYEQLRWWSRFHLQRNCRRRGWGLIVTSHRSAGLPELFNITATLELTNRVVRELLQNSEFYVSEQEIADRFARRQGNLRELLFDLYDLFERRRTS